jgi:predicted DNA-binding helix-hairpin-helix protein
LKVLLTNACNYDCLYCVNRASSNVPRARFTIDEIVKLTIDFYRRNYIEGLREQHHFREPSTAPVTVIHLRQLLRRNFAPVFHAPVTCPKLKSP